VVMDTEIRERLQTQTCTDRAVFQFPMTADRNAIYLYNSLLFRSVNDGNLACLPYMYKTKNLIIFRSDFCNFSTIRNTIFCP
jgi:hypothetical protein